MMSRENPAKQKQDTSMKHTDAERRAQIEQTHDMSLDMLDDLAHFREIIAKEKPTSSDIRRMSGQLRRLLIDNGGDIRKVWPPRMRRRLFLSSLDVSPEIDRSKRERLIFASLGASGLFGSTFSSVSFAHGPKLTFGPPTITMQGIPEGPKEISLSHDGFLAQKVLFYGERWISRNEVIKYVANVAGGVHSSAPRLEVDSTLHSLREVAEYRLIEGNISLRVHTKSFMPQAPKPIDVDREGVNIVLFQLMSAARYLVVSPDITELEEVIRSEGISKQLS